MDSILTDVSSALENGQRNYLREKIITLQQKIKQRMIQYEAENNGFISMEHLRFVSQPWMEILVLIGNPDKKKFTCKILELFQVGEFQLFLQMK